MAQRIQECYAIWRRTAPLLCFKLSASVYAHSKITFFFLAKVAETSHTMQPSMFIISNVLFSCTDSLLTRKPLVRKCNTKQQFVVDVSVIKLDIYAKMCCTIM